MEATTDEAMEATTEEAMEVTTAEVTEAMNATTEEVAGHERAPEAQRSPVTGDVETTVTSGRPGALVALASETNRSPNQTSTIVIQE